MTEHPCPWCGELMWHHLTHVCVGCTCTYTETWIPGEPQLGSYLEAEQDPFCSIHPMDPLPELVPREDH